MVRATIDDVKQDLPGYLRRVEAGETVVITRAEKAVAEIKPLPGAQLEPRPFGLCAGEFAVPDDFDEPLPEETIEPFEGK